MAFLRSVSSLSVSSRNFNSSYCYEEVSFVARSGNLLFSSCERFFSSSEVSVLLLKAREDIRDED